MRTEVLGNAVFWVMTRKAEYEQVRSYFRGEEGQKTKSSRDN